MNQHTMNQQLSAAWVEEYFRVVDSMDAEALVAFYAPDGLFQFANQAPWSGRDAIRAGLRGFYGAIVGMHHQQQGVWLAEDGASAVFEARVTFSKADGSQEVLPAASILRVRKIEGQLQVTDFRMMDASPLMKPAEHRDLPAKEKP